MAMSSIRALSTLRRALVLNSVTRHAAEPCAVHLHASHFTIVLCVTARKCCLISSHSHTHTHCVLKTLRCCLVTVFSMEPALRRAAPKTRRTRSSSSRAFLESRRRARAAGRWARPSYLSRTLTTSSLRTSARRSSPTRRSSFSGTSAVRSHARGSRT